MQFIRTGVFCLFLCLLGFIHGQSNPGDSTEEVGCSGDWVSIHRGCYMFVVEGEPWSTALDSCKDRGGELTTIQSLKEKEELHKYLAANFKDTQKWWVGLKRNASTNVRDDWKWIDNNILDTNVVPWKDPNMRFRPGEVCGYVNVLPKEGTVPSKFLLTVTRCTGNNAFICEYHSILPRSEPATEATTIATITAAMESTTLEQPAVASPQTTESCSCRDSTNVLSSDSVDTDGLSSDSVETPEDRLRRRNQALTIDEELYQRYLQSEIDANNAKVVYYSEVAKYYHDALDSQNKYYNSYRQKLDLEISQIQQVKTCT